MEPGPVRLALVLRPQRSLSPAGFAVLMGLLAAISFAAGTVFFVLGAWPVVGFLGLDVVLIYAAFRLSYARARECERLILADDALVIERVTRRHEERVVLEPFWLRVELHGPPGRPTGLVLASHGRFHPVGGFLAPAERLRLAALLADALATLRAPPSAAAPATGAARRG